MHRLEGVYEGEADEAAAFRAPHPVVDCFDVSVLDGRVDGRASLAQALGGGDFVQKVLDGFVRVFESEEFCAVDMFVEYAEDQGQCLLQGLLARAADDVNPVFELRNAFNKFVHNLFLMQNYGALRQKSGKVIRLSRYPSKITFVTSS